MRFSSGVLGLVCLFSTRAALAWSNDPTIDDVVSSNYFVEINPALTSDGAGGLIIAWVAQTNGDDIRSQRLDATGARLWSTSGITIAGANGKQSVPRAISDGAGGAIVVWDDERSNTHAVYAQRVLANGTVAWATDGILVSTETAELMSPMVVTDGSGGAIVSMRRIYSSAKNAQLQRLDKDGNRLWGNSGVATGATSGTDDGVPSLIGDGAGGAFVAWNTGSVSQAVLVQRLDSSGAKKWGANGLQASTTTNSFPTVELVSDDAGGIFAIWDNGAAGASQLRARHVSSAGSATGSADTPLSGLSSTDPSPHMSVGDGAGGVVTVWQRATATNQELYMQHLDSSTATKWGNDGKVVATGLDPTERPVLSRSTLGKFVTSWITKDLKEIRAQSLDSTGALGWATAGVAVSADTSGGFGALDTIAFTGGATIIAFDRAFAGMDVYAKLLSSSGTLGEEATDGGVDGGGGAAGGTSDGGVDAPSGGGTTASGGTSSGGSGAISTGGIYGTGAGTSFGGSGGGIYGVGASGAGASTGNGGSKASGGSDDGGCGCRAVGARSEATLGIGALLLLVLARLSPNRRRGGSDKGARSKSRARTP